MIYLSFSFSSGPIDNFIIGFWPEYDHPGVLVSIQIESDSTQLPYDFILNVPDNAKMVIETVINGDDKVNNILSVESDNNSEISYISSRIKSQRYLLQFYYNPFSLTNNNREINYFLNTNIDLFNFYIVIQKHLGALEYKINLKNMETIEDSYGITYYRKKIDQLASKDSLLVQIKYQNSMNKTTMDILNQKLEKPIMESNESINSNIKFDNRKRYNTNKLYVLTVLIITTLLVLILYFIYNQDNYNLNNYIMCKKCTKLIKNTDVFCSFCGGRNVS